MYDICWLNVWPHHMVVDHPLYFQLILRSWDDIILEPSGCVKGAGAGQTRAGGRGVVLGGPPALAQDWGLSDMVRYTGGGGSLLALFDIIHSWRQRGNSHGSIILIIKLYFDTIKSGTAVHRPMCTTVHASRVSYS